MTLEDKIIEILHRKIGFNPASVGTETIASALRDHLSRRKIENVEEFIRALETNPKEFNEIVDAVVIPETWFFRDVEPFTLLKTHVETEWSARSNGGLLRCLSVPSSTGEEPYSIAMTLLNSGLAPDQFQVDAVDISLKSQARAKSGVYGSYSFRSKDLSFRELYFSKIDNGYRIKDFVRTPVRFMQGNLLDPGFINDGRQYDVIFCRNLLIYFDEAGWTLAVKALDRLLTDNGILFMGHAEALEMAAPQFESARVPCAFAYRRKRPIPAVLRKKNTIILSSAQTSGERRATLETTRPASNSAQTRSLRPATPTSKFTFSPVESPVLLPPDKLPADSLESAGLLADSGKLAEAATVCERHLAKFPASAQGWFLLGLIRMGEGKTDDAELLFNKTLYLDSRHYEALIHLALLREGRGDRDGGSAFRRRAQRLKETR